jgi:hypothetical protein
VGGDYGAPDTRQVLVAPSTQVGRGDYGFSGTRFSDHHAADIAPQTDDLA